LDKDFIIGNEKVIEKPSIVWTNVEEIDRKSGVFIDRDCEVIILYCFGCFIVIVYGLNFKDQNPVRLRDEEGNNLLIPFKD